MALLRERCVALHIKRAFAKLCCACARSPSRDPARPVKGADLFRNSTSLADSGTFCVALLDYVTATCGRFGVDITGQRPRPTPCTRGHRVVLRWSLRPRRRRRCCCPARLQLEAKMPRATNRMAVGKVVFLRVRGGWSVVRWLRSLLERRLLEFAMSRSVFFSCRRSHKERRTFNSLSAWSQSSSSRPGRPPRS